MVFPLESSQISVYQDEDEEQDASITSQLLTAKVIVLPRVITNISMPPQTEYQRQNKFLLNIIVGQCPSIFQLFPSEYKPLSIRWNTFFILNLSLHIANSIRALNLKEVNYLTWRRAITNALLSKHKIVFVDGRLPKPAEGDPDEENWITCNSMVMSWILNSLNKELHDSIVYHDTARDEELESSQNGEDDNNQLAQVEDLKPMTKLTRAR
ncbi:Retrotransposon Copia-like, N-terminal [Dillenia turbinata]|uniref:Retrotransposon Copia-like, N-terminal n=1 Tax=Dillenia turbinata TaxID=194707 RepID=A0AAN8UMD6_9MAGN